MFGVRRGAPHLLAVAAVIFSQGCTSRLSAHPTEAPTSTPATDASGTAHKDRAPHEEASQENSNSKETSKDPFWNDSRLAEFSPSRGTEASGGGNAWVSQAFVSTAWDLVNQFSQLKEPLPEWFKLDEFRTAIEKAKVYAIGKIEDPLGYRRGIFLHARFDQVSQTIEVDSDKVESLSREALYHLVLHEYLGIMGKEGDGHYARSTQILNLINENADPSGVYAEFSTQDGDLKCSSELFDPVMNEKYSNAQAKWHLPPGTPVEYQIFLEVQASRAIELAKRFEKDPEGKRASLDPNLKIPDCGFGVDEDGTVNTPTTPCATFSPLLVVALKYSSSLETVRLLIDQGASLSPDLSQEKPGNRTLLGISLHSAWQDPRIPELLVDRGAPYKKDGKFDSTIFWNFLPTDENSYQILCPMKRKLRFLIKLGADINAWSGEDFDGLASGTGVNAAHQFASNNNLTMMKLFQSFGLKIDQVAHGLPEDSADQKYFEDGLNGRTGIHFLAELYRQHRIPMIKAFLKAGVLASAKNAHGHTALFIAKKGFEYEKCETIETRGADWCSEQRRVIDFLSYAEDQEAKAGLTDKSTSKGAQ